MQDSNPQADGNAEARSRDEWRSDRSADTVLRDGARIPTPADGAGAASALEEGVWGRNLLKVSPQLAQPQRLKTRHPIKPMNARNQGSHPAAAKQGKTERSSAPKLTQGATPTRLGTQRIPGQTDCG